MDTIFIYGVYSGDAHYSAEDDVWYGRVLYIDDLVSYEAVAPDRLETEFRLSVNDYLRFCAAHHKTPQTSLTMKGAA